MPYALWHYSILLFCCGVACAQLHLLPRLGASRFAALMDQPNSFPTQSVLLAPINAHLENVSFLLHPDYALHRVDFVHVHIVDELRVNETVTSRAGEPVTVTEFVHNRTISVHTASPQNRRPNLIVYPLGEIQTIEFALYPYWWYYHDTESVLETYTGQTRDCTKFLALVRASQIDIQALNGTLLAVSNPGISDSLFSFLMDESNVAILERVVYHHLLPKIVNYKTLSPILYTRLGTSLSTKVKHDHVHFDNAVSQNYLLTKYGIVYLVDRLLLPPGLEYLHTTSSSVAAALFSSLLLRSNSGDCTVFLPLGTALSDLGARNLSSVHQQDLLDYHTTLVSFPTFGNVTMKNNDTIRAVNTKDGVHLYSNGGAPAKVNHIYLGNGAYLIDHVLFPKWMSTGLESLLESYGDYWKLWKKANMETYLLNEQHVTVLIPLTIPSQTFQFLIRHENMDLLERILHYNVLPNVFEFSNEASLPTKFPGYSMQVTRTVNNLFFNNVSSLSFQLYDTGIVHFVQRLLIPPPLQHLLPTEDSGVALDTSIASPYLFKQQNEQDALHLINLEGTSSP